jgi:hypothetical protein
MAKDKEKKTPTTDFVVKRPERHRVCAGKTVICQKSPKMREGKQPISADDLAGGKEALDALVDKGIVETYK